MEAHLMRWRRAAIDLSYRADWAAVATWILACGLIVYLGVKGGGYDPLVHDQVGVAVWWVLLLGVAAGALPRRRPTILTWCSLGLLTALVLWTALGLTWTESEDRTSADLARIAGYLGVFTLACFAFAEKGTRRMVGAVAAGIAVVTVLALLSRLHPVWFPEAGQTAAFLSSTRERLSYPLNYWNALAALIAMGFPLMLHVATSARSVLIRATAAAVVPAMALTIFYTLSRTGMVASAVAISVFVVLARDRLPRLGTLLVAASGGVVAILFAAPRNALQDGLLNTTADSQGDEVLLVTILVCFVVGLLQAVMSTTVFDDERRPDWIRVRRSHAVGATVAAAIAVLLAALALGAPGRLSDAWGEFKEGGSPGKGTERLSSASGQSRYQFWSAAVDQNATKPLTGTGSGTFEYWWARNGDRAEVVRDTHSLYLQTLGELGIIGLALLVAFLGLLLVAGGRFALRADDLDNPALAAAVAAFAAFCIDAAFDWIWQIPVLPVVLLLLASVVVSAAIDSEGAEPGALWLPARAGFVLLSIAAIIAIAIPLASTSLLQQSEADAREGNLSSALEAARSAQNVQLGAAAPRLQEALVLEEMGDLAPAASAARAATEREATNWRTWLILSRIEAERGKAAAAVRDYRKARSLNPHSALFD